MNSRLRQQIRKHLGDHQDSSPGLTDLLEEIDDTYRRFERDHKNLERSLQRALNESQQLRCGQARRDGEARTAEAEQLAVTLRSIGDGVVTATSRGEVLLMNRVAEQLTGWTQQEAAGKSLEQVLNVVDRQPGPGFPHRVEEVSRDTLSMSGLLIRRNGSRLAISNRMSPMHDENGRIVGVVIVFRDVTEERHHAEERLKASKLESVGLLAGGIAHDFNNFLTVILGNIALARSLIPEAAKAIELLERSESASRQARDLTQQLLTFSPGGTPVKKTASARELIEECASFALRGSNVRCELDVVRDLRAVEIDRGQIAQVLHNLIINADQAMPGGGVIAIRAANESVEVFDSRPLKPGVYVMISVQDRGIGIPAAHLEKVFDPYFTTKEKGSGLGLATSYSIAKNHQGWIDVRSIPGELTCFSIYLPAAEAGAVVEESGEKQRILARGGRILVMDDDPSVRGVAEEMLRFLGYEVALATDGEEMIDLYRRALEEDRRFDAVITDLTIPGGMGGGEAVAGVLEIDPAARVIVSSGYSNDPIMADYRSHGFNAVLRKPFDVEELGRALDEVRAAGPTVDAS